MHGQQNIKKKKIDYKFMFFKRRYVLYKTGRKISVCKLRYSDFLEAGQAITIFGKNGSKPFTYL